MPAEDEARRLLDWALFDWTPKQYCEKLSPIESLLQYRFATPKPLKACPGPGRCRTAPLCNPFLVLCGCLLPVLFRLIYPQTRRSYYLFFTTCSYYL